ncbi:hypothetical protein ASD62_17715 [Phycicoccus sp. Root563]|nr:hypothetical protein ASD62_17715 [Phycicoccus sp. Root563]
MVDLLAQQWTERGAGAAQPGLDGAWGDPQLGGGFGYSQPDQVVQDHDLSLGDRQACQRSLDVHGLISGCWV